MKKIIFYLTIVVCFSFLFVNCEKNEQNDLVNEHFGIKQKYERQQITFKEIKKDKDAYMFIYDNHRSMDQTKKSGDYDNFGYIVYKDSSKITAFYNEKVKTYTLPIITNLEKAENDFFNLIIKKHKGKTSFFVVKYSPEDKWNKEEVFKGKITFFDEKGKISASINTTERNKKTFNLKSSNCIGYVIVYGECDCGGNADGHAPSGAECCDGSPAIGYEYTGCGGGGGGSDWDTGNGGGILDGGGTPTSPDTISDLFKFKQIFESNGINLSNDEELWLYNHPNKIKDLLIFLDKEKWSSESKNFTKMAINALMNDAEVNFEERIIIDKTLKEMPCQKDIVEYQYKNRSQLAQFIMSAFGGDQNKVNLTYKVEDLPNPLPNVLVNGGTTPGAMKPDGSLELSISLDKQAAEEGSDLLIATTIIHENVHALLTYMEGVINFNINNTNPTLSELAEAYAKWKGNPNNPQQTTEDTEHFYMTELVDKMADALQTYGESKGYNIERSYYEALCWSADMKEHAKSELQNAINRAYMNERLLADSSYSKGKKCN